MKIPDGYEEHALTFPGEYKGIRFDTALSKMLPQLSRSRAGALIKNGCALLNGKAAKAGQGIRAGDAALVMIPRPRPIKAEPQEIPIDIVYQDSQVAVVNKPRGMVVHPAAGNYDGTLVNALLYHLEGLSGINGEIRPGIVHRLDKDTSGLLVVAKTDAAHRSLERQIKKREVKRIYWAIAHGNPRQDEGTIEAPIGRHRTDRKKMAVCDGGRSAVTHYRVLERFEKAALIEARLETGRTHQIRVHMAHIGHPLLGDKVYGREKDGYGLDGQALHAGKLGFYHPESGKWMEFSAPLPEDFMRVLEKLRKR